MFLGVIFWFVFSNATLASSLTLNLNDVDVDTTLTISRSADRNWVPMPKKIGSTVFTRSSIPQFHIFTSVVNDFQGAFAPNNWTFNPNGGDGSVNVNNAPASISLTGSDNQSGNENATTYCIQLPGSGLAILSFEWDFLTSDDDGAEWDPFGYTIDATTTQLTNNAGPNSQSGSVDILLEGGVDFCFLAFSADQLFGSATTEITNFRYEDFSSPDIVIDPFTTTGTWTAPDRVENIVVQAWGGGGGGGPTTGNARRGGGGGGAYATNLIAVTPGDTYDVIIGQGGASGQDGGNSFFDNGSTVLAQGGIQGANGGGAGGQAASSTGSIVFSGGNGGNRSNNSGGGGGGSAFVSSNGNNGTDAAGGTPGTGGSGEGSGGNGGANGQPGINGQFPGGGGGGRGSGGGNSGSGGNGYIIISYSEPKVPDALESTIVSADAELVANGLAQTVITVELVAEDGINYGFDGEDVLFTTNAGNLSDGAASASGTSILGFDNGDGTYTVTLTSSTTIETATVSAYLGSTISDPLIGTVNIEFTSLPPGEFVVIFDTPGSYDWPIPAGVLEIDILVVGGGGGGGTSTAFSTAGSGGGGGGGYIYIQDYDVTSTINPVPIIVGAGGSPGATGNNSGINGQNSSFDSLVGLGGGGGIGGNGAGNNGGSGGGARGGSGGSALQPSSASGGDGFSGGNSGGSPGRAAASGGGGAGGVGQSVAGVVDENGGNGGPGLQNDISGSLEFYAAGGGGGASRTDGQPGSGGSGIGGNGGNDAIVPTQGADGTGSGGGGGNNSRVGARGGHGIVIIRYFIADDFYSRANGSWQDENTWTFDPSHSGPATPFSPTSSSSVFIAQNHEVVLNDDVTNNDEINVNNTGILQTNDYIISGSGTFNLSAGGTLGISSADGIESAGSVGSIQTSTRNFNEAANYIFNGTVNQVTGGGLPLEISELGIDNPGEVTLTNNLRVENNLDLQNGTLVVLDGLLLQIDQNTIGNATIRIEEGANYIDFSESYPNLEIQREITGVKGWRLVASPVNTDFEDLFDGFITQGFTGSAFPSLQPNVLTFNESSIGTTNMAWRQPSNSTEAVPAGKGYFHFVFDGAERPDDSVNYTDELPITMTASGSEHNLNSGSFSFNISFTERDPGDPQVGDPFIDINENDTGWNLVGNPTASSLFWNNPSAWTRTNVDDTIYIWDPTLNDGDFRVSNGLTGNIQGHKIAPFQGFWVRTNDDNPELTFNQDAKTVDATWYGRPADADIENKDHVVVSLIARAAGMTAESRLMFSDDGSLNQNKKDAYRLNPLADSWLSLTTARTYGGNPLVINALPKQIDEVLNIPIYLGGVVNQKSLNDNFELLWRVPGDWSDRYKLTLMDHERNEAISMQEVVQTSFFHVTESEILPINRWVNSNHKKIAEDTTVDAINVPRSVLFSGEHQLSMLQTTPEPPRFSILITPIDQDVTYTPFEVTLNQNYPNPFNPVTTIVFSLPNNQNVSLDIYDILGRRVANLVNNTFAAGTHQVTWNAQNSASGVYIYRLRTEDSVITRKMTLVK